MRKALTVLKSIHRNCRNINRITASTVLRKNNGIIPGMTKTVAGCLKIRAESSLKSAKASVPKKLA